MLVTRTGQRWEFRPTWCMAVGPFVGSALLLAISMFCSYFFFRIGTLPIDTLAVSGVLPAVLGGVLCCAPCFFLTAWVFGVGVQHWQSRNVPLIVEDSGRISYREQEVCASGTVRAVVIVTFPEDDEVKERYRVILERAGRNVLELPPPYFNKESLTFADREQANSLAEKFATAFGVEIERKQKEIQHNWA